MAAPGPAAAFAGASLELAKVAAGTVLGRIYQQRFADPLGFGKLPSRFSDPRRLAPERRFGVVYLGASLKVCFLETMLRDARDGAVGDWPLEERELDLQRYAQIRVRAPLALVDLRGDGPVRMGRPAMSPAPRGNRWPGVGALPFMSIRQRSTASSIPHASMARPIWRSMIARSASSTSRR